MRVVAQTQGACALRASPAVASLAEAAGRGAARRLARPLTVGAPLEDDTPRSLGACVVGLTRGPGGLRIFAADAAGALREVEVGDDGDAAATARALAVALSTLLLQLVAGNHGNPAQPEIANPSNPANPARPEIANPSNPANPAQPTATNPTQANPENPADTGAAEVGNPSRGAAEGRAGAVVRAVFVAGAQVRAPVSVLRGTGGVGLGGVLGLCLVERVCALLSAEYVLPSERPAWAGAPAAYRWGNAAAVAQITALRRGSWVLGAGLGVVARLSEATLDGRTTRGTSLSAGVRVQLEGSLALGRLGEAVLGLGTDLYVDRAAFVQGGQTLLVEDFVTPWALFSARFRAP